MRPDLLISKKKKEVCAYLDNEVYDRLYLYSELRSTSVSKAVNEIVDFALQGLSDYVKDHKNLILNARRDLRKVTKLHEKLIKVVAMEAWDNKGMCEADMVFEKKKNPCKNKSKYIITVLGDQGPPVKLCKIHTTIVEGELKKYNKQYLKEEIIRNGK